MTTSSATPSRLSLASILIALALVLLLTGCGRRGSPELPPSATVITTDQQGNTVEKPADPVDRPFILDPLLQ